MISIREAEQRDLAEIIRLHRQASEFRGRLDPRLAPGSEGTEEFRNALQPTLGKGSCRVFVAQKDGAGRLLGCVIGKVVDNRPFSVPELGLISFLHVDEGWRGGEIGRGLSAAICDWFKAEGLNAAQVDVSLRDAGGRRFWEKRGFAHFLDHLCRDTEREATTVVEPSVVVRRGHAGDLEAVLSLWEEMMGYHAPLDRRLEVSPRGRGYVARSIGHWLGNQAFCLLVADAGDTVIGFALGGLVDAWRGLKPATYGHIAHMCVTANWRRCGIGRQLFPRLRDWFEKKSLSSIHIYVSHFSPVSQRFWRRVGFEDYIERLWCDL